MKYQEVLNIDVLHKKLQIPDFDRTVSMIHM